MNVAFLSLERLLPRNYMGIKDKDIAMLCENDITSAEELISILTTLKVATTALRKEQIPTISMILRKRRQG